MNYKISQVNPYFTKDEEKEVLESLRSTWVTEGPKAKAFVEEMLKLTGAKYGVLAPNGTLSLYMALMVAGIGPGDEVIVTDFSMIASSNAIYLTGATPIFVDINKDDLNMDINKMEKAITKKTKAIMPVHIYGAACDMDKVMSIAKKHKLLVVEDACQGHGLFYKNKHVGTIGDLGCFSFFADKTFTTGGEGGMIITNDKKIHEKLLYFRNQGRLSSGTFIHPEIGYNFRMTDLQCAVGLAQIRKFDDILKKRLANHAIYEKYLRGIKDIKVIRPFSYSNFVPFRFNILVPDVKKLIKLLEDNGIQTRGMFYPLHKQPCYKMYKYNDSDFPNSIYAYEHGLSLPVYYSLTEDQIKYVCDVVRQLYPSK